jgi:hypothetical protein
MKDSKEFANRSNALDGKQYWCKKCRNTRMREERKAGKWNKPSGPYKTIRVGSRVTREHRVVIEEIIGRRLIPNELVHHINGNGLDNQIENLAIVTPVEHYEIHRMLAVEQ